MRRKHQSLEYRHPERYPKYFERAKKMNEEQRWQRYWSDFRAMMGQPDMMTYENFSDEELAKMLRESVECVDAMMTALTERGYSVWLATSTTGLMSGRPSRPLQVMIRKSIEL